MHEDACERYRALVEETDVLFLSADCEGRIDFANEAAGRFFGEPRGSLLGRTFDRLLEPDERLQLETDLEAAPAQGCAVQAERTARRGDGQARVLLWQHQRVVLADGHVRWHLVASDVTELRDAHNKLEQLVYRDPLTGLPNRRLFDDRITQMHARHRRCGTRFALHLIDLDHFKAVNDSFGHGVGDELLRQVTDRLTTVLRESDTLARLGGDEFAILQPDIDSETDAEVLARKVNAQLAIPFHIEGHEICIGGSIGIALAGDAPVNPQQLMQQADRVLYAVKESGRGFHAFDTSELGEAARGELELARALEQATTDGSLFLVWQPEYNLRRGCVTAVEALLRWRRPDGSVVGPARLVAIAERHGLIQAIGDWVLEKALAQFAAWRAAGVDAPRLCINLSVLQLRDEALAERVGHALARHGVPPHALELELTESGFTGDERIMLDSMKRLADLGISLAVDDFGTGYSSFTYLRRFAFTRLKVAEGFAERSTSNLDELAILRAAVSLAGGLGMEAVVEGVESAGALEALRSMGVESIQGYLVSRPEDSDRMEYTLRHPEGIAERVAAPA